MIECCMYICEVFGGRLGLVVRDRFLTGADGMKRQKYNAVEGETMQTYV